jgi:23S rRNA (adenine2503-C2)-methyltransferase
VLHAEPSASVARKLNGGAGGRPALACARDLPLEVAVRSVLAYTPDELREEFTGAQIEPYRADQVAGWVYERGVREFARMTSLSRAHRARLAAGWTARALALGAVHRSLDGTRKLELRTHDGAQIEAVIIPQDGRQTVCVSSQIGCSLDCSFCATGRLGLRRNLRAEEIVDQVLLARDLLAPESAAPTHVVFMGMGEPLLNLGHVIRALRILTHPRALGLAPRRITVSTAGVVPRLAELAAELPVRLAVSLHATTDAVRDELVPLNRRFPIARLVEACRALPASRRDLVTLEYTLIREVNDSDADARRLARLANSLRAKINLIPLNEHPASPYVRPEDERVDRFAALLVAGGARVTVRRSRGDDVFAACGQLGRLTPPGRSSATSAPVLPITTAG